MKCECLVTVLHSILHTVGLSMAGLKKVLSSCPGQVDFPANWVSTLVAVHSHLSKGEG